MDVCGECPYKKYPSIPKSKPFEAEVAIVGEAPGTQEIAQKKPFVGPAGQLLNKALQTVDLPPREDIFVTNALLCKPPKNKPQLKTAIKCCQRRLSEELKQVNPRLIIALGNIGMHATTNDFDLKVTKAQGTIQQSPFAEGAKVIPMLHPAAILRAPGEYKLFYGTMQRASEMYHGGEPPDPGKTEWWAAETDEDIRKAIEELKKYQGEIVAADIETTALKARQGEMLVIGICPEKNHVIVIPGDKIPKELFTEVNVKWGWQGGKFDQKWLRHNNYEANVHHDAMLLSYTLNEHSGVHGLEQLATRLLGAEPYKHKVKEKVGKKGFGALPKHDLYERVAVDADYTKQVIDKLLSRVKKNSQLDWLYHKLLIPASDFLRRVEENGIYVNVPVLEEFEKEYQQELDEINDEILRYAQPLWSPEKYKQDTSAKTAPEVFNPGSTYQLAWMLYDRIGLRPPIKKKGRSTDKEVLEALEGQHPIVDKMREYRTVQKELSTYITGVKDKVDEDNRVRTTFNLHVTSTGRLSSKEPNVQNQPKRRPQVRNMYQAPEGKVLIEKDYKGAELRVLADRSGDVYLKDCFIQGRDLHAEVAESLGLARIRAKAVNFGIPYGRTKYSLSDELDISLEEAEGYIEGWFEKYPQAKKFLDDCARAPAEGRTLVTPFGRHRRFGLVSKQNLDALQNEARNFIIQSVASDLTLWSAMEAEAPLAELDVKIINLVHDSILLEAPADPKIVEEAMVLISEIMMEVPKKMLNSDVPFPTDYNVGWKWGDLTELDDVKEVYDIVK